MKQKKVIDYRFKLLYAVAMIMIVCGHAQNGGITLFNTWFPYYGFHLALFMFASGYFYNALDEKNVLSYILKKIKKLLLPLFIYNILYGIFVLVLYKYGYSIGLKPNLYTLFIMPIVAGTQFRFNLGGWFIIPLFMIEIFNIIFRKIIKISNKKIKEIFVLVFYILIGILGNMLAIKGLNTGWWLVLVRMLFLIPFFSLGTFYKAFLEKYDKQISNTKYLSFVLLIQFILILYYKRPITFNPPWCNNLNNGPIMPIVVGYIGIAFWFRIVSILEPILGKNKLVNNIADNTYSIMINQYLGFFIVNSCYAIISKFTNIISDFNFANYKSNINYFYLIRGVNQSLIIYVIAGIAIPILIQKCINKIKKQSKKFFNIKM